jgi:hypothetical protein
MGLVFAETRYYVLINKAHLARVKTLNRFFLRRIIFFFILGFLFCPLVSMADADGSCLNLGSPTAPRGRGRPCGIKNKTAPDVVGSSSSVSVKRRPGRPVGSKNKPVMPCAIPGPSAPPGNTSPPQPKIYSFFCIAGAQCREIQWLSLKFTKFMDGRELREAILRQHSGGGTPYVVEVWYDGAGEQYFKGGWSQFVDDHDIQRGFFLSFDYHIGTSKFDVKIFDCTQC